MITGDHSENDDKKENWENYPKSIFKHTENFDLILVDGRFRVACALCSIYKMNDDSILLFDDYTPRKQYHVIEPFFEKIETVDSMTVFKKKSNIDLSELEKLIEEYKNNYE